MITFESFISSLEKYSFSNEHAEFIETQIRKGQVSGIRELFGRILHTLSEEPTTGLGFVRDRIIKACALSNDFDSAFAALEFALQVPTEKYRPNRRRHVISQLANCAVSRGNR